MIINDATDIACAGYKKWMLLICKVKREYAKTYDDDDESEINQLKQVVGRLVGWQGTKSLYMYAVWWWVRDLGTRGTQRIN